MDQSQKVRSDIDEILKQSSVLLRQGNFQAARSVLNKALSVDFDKDEVITALKSVSFWEERLGKLEKIGEGRKRGEFLFSQWEQFLVFMHGCSSVCAEIHYPIKQWVFSRIITALQSEIERDGGHDADLLLSLGRAYKGLGDFEHAVEFLEHANHQRTDSPEIIAELADAYACVNETRAAKIFFREAFYLNPQKVRLEYLESMLISRLIEKVGADFDSLEEIKEWIPVYGNVYGVFNVKREMKPLEYGKLKQSIFHFEELVARDSDAQKHVNVPKLLNKYIWLIDHLLNTKQERAKIEEILQKIKMIDKDIYEKMIQ